MNGETPANYFSKFRRVLEAATKNGYFKRSPVSDLAAISKSDKRVKEILETGEYKKLIHTPCINYEVKNTFVFSIYTGFRWLDTKPLRWENFKTKYRPHKARETDIFLPVTQSRSQLLNQMSHILNGV